MPNAFPGLVKIQYVYTPSHAYVSPSVEAFGREPRWAAGGHGSLAGALRAIHEVLRSINVVLSVQPQLLFVAGVLLTRAKPKRPFIEQYYTHCTRLDHASTDCCCFSCGSGLCVHHAPAACGCTTHRCSGRAVE
jgi:hypothetical protein